MTNRKVMNNFTFWLLTAQAFWWLLKWDKYWKVQQYSIGRTKRLYCELHSEVFLLLHIYLLNEKQLHADALKKKHNTAELQVLFIKVISWLVPLSFSFLLYYYLFHNENNFISSASCVVMASVSSFCKQQALRIQFLQSFLL